jgi:hypothetical protein
LRPILCCGPQEEESELTIALPSGIAYMFL